MGKNKSPRKSYKQKPVVLPMPYRFNRDGEIDLQLIPHLEFQKLKLMCADDETWNTLAARVNVGYVLANSYAGDKQKTACSLALDALVLIKNRHYEIGKFWSSGDELEAIGEALNLTDDMQKASTRRDLRDALEHVYEVAGIKTREETMK
jgi:hypothetical protein